MRPLARLLLLCVVLVTTRGATIAAADEDTAATLIKSVLQREALLQDIGGLVVHNIFRSEGIIEAHERRIERRLEELGGGHHVPIHSMTDHTQLVVRFAAAAALARWEVIALEGGTGPWRGVPSVAGRMQVARSVWDDMQIGDYARTVLVRDGVLEMSYDNYDGIGAVRSQERRDPVTRQAPLCYLLLLGHQGGTVGQDLQRLYEAAQKKTEGTPNEDTRFTYAGEEQVGNIPCHKLVFTKGTPEFSSQVATWISADYGYAVVQHRTFVRDKKGRKTGTGRFYSGRDYRETAPGVWLPHKTVTQHFYYSAKIEDPWRDTETATFYDLEANVGLTERDFQYRFPLGTMITDPEGLYPWHLPQALRKPVEYIPPTLEAEPPPAPDAELRGR